MNPRLLLPPVRACSDGHLARRAAGGDDDAYTALYARYQPRLETYCRSIVRNDEDARDAMQNAMTKALVALRRDATSITNVQAWLFRIAHNEAITVLRRRRPTIELATDIAEPGGDPASDLLVREELSAVLVGVRELPGRLQQPLLLRELAGLSYGQVAAVTGGTPAAARKAVFDARVALSADREGRDEACAVIRRSLSEGDYRRRRARIVRSHLRVCGACRAWEHDLSARRRQLVALLPAGAASGSLWAWLGGLFGTGASAAVGVVSNAKVAAAVVAIGAGATVPVVVEREGGTSAGRTTASTSARTAAGRAAPAGSTTKATTATTAKPAAAAAATIRQSRAAAAPRAATGAPAVAPAREDAAAAGAQRNAQESQPASATPDRPAAARPRAASAPADRTQHPRQTSAPRAPDASRQAAAHGARRQQAPDGPAAAVAAVPEPDAAAPMAPADVG